MPEANIQQWKTRPVFISSTFRDMQAERDHLRNFVFPRLEEELRKRRHHLEWIDLRQGVESGHATTEEQRELLVLKVCLEEIKRSRPFLIVLLGDRYGWVPPAERMEAAAREAGLQTDAKDKSVTALEIEFGLFKESPDQQHRCFFYLREPLPYDKMPEELRATYSEQFASDEHAPSRRAALDELKKSLRDDPEIRPRIRTYKAGWDSQKKSLAGLEEWGGQVFEDLWRELDDETRAFAAKPAPTWEQAERDALAEFVEQRSRDFTGREQTIQQLLTLARSPAIKGNSWALCVSGPAGSGKSAIFSELHRCLESSPHVLLLANAAGATQRGSSAYAMLQRWIGQLAGFLDAEQPKLDDATVEQIDQAFALLLERAASKTRVVILLDAFDQFENTPRAKKMAWRPNSWPSNVRFIATSLPGEQAKNLSQWPGVSETRLMPLEATESRSIAQKVCRRYRSPWADSVWYALQQKTGSDGVNAIGNPLWTILACERLALLDADDFAHAEGGLSGDPQSSLTELRCELAAQMPPDVPGLYQWLLAQMEKVHGKAWTQSLAATIALSRRGWRETDLYALVPQMAAILAPETPVSRLSPLKLAELRRAFRAHLVKRGAEEELDFHHAQMREAVNCRYLNGRTDITALHRIIADHLDSLPRSTPYQRDPLAERELMYHLLRSNDTPRAASFLSGQHGVEKMQRTGQEVADYCLSSPKGRADVLAMIDCRDLPESDRWRLLDQCATLVPWLLSNMGAHAEGIVVCEAALAKIRSEQKPVNHYINSRSVEEALEQLSHLYASVGDQARQDRVFREWASLITKDGLPGETNPGDVQRWIGMLLRSTQMELSEGRTEEAFKTLAKAGEFAELLSPERRGGYWYAADIAEVLICRARLLIELCRFDEAQPFAQRGWELLAEAHEFALAGHVAGMEIAGSDSHRLGPLWIQCGLANAIVLRKLDNVDRSVALLEKLVATAEELERRNPDDVGFARLSLAPLAELGYVHALQTKDLAAAERALLSRLQRAQILANKIGSYEDMHDYIMSLHDLGGFYHDIRGDVTMANQAWTLAHRELIEILRRGFTLDPELADLLQKMEQAAGR